MTVRDDKPRASRMEILGAWLHVWTAPRDVVVPPVPWRKVAAGAAVLVLAGVVTALVIAPAIDEAKEESAAEEQRALDERADARRADLVEEQRARTGRLPRGEPALPAVERLIGADAAERFGTDGGAATCDPASGAKVRPGRRVFDCFATVRDIRGAGEQEGARATLAIPYRAMLDTGARRYAFCKVNPRAAEGSTPDPRSVVPLPPVCRAR